MLAAGFFLLRAKTCEPAGKLLFFLYLAVQVQFICHNVTFYIYNIWFAGMLQWDYTWGDILGYGLLMLLLTPLFAWASRRIYLRLRTINSRQYMRLWLIPLLFILLHILQSSFFTISRYAYVAVGIRIMIDVCAFITYSQMASAISSAAKAAREAEQRDGLVRQLDLQRARAEDLESHAGEIRRIRHDRRQHAQVVLGLLNQGKTDEARSYMKDYADSMEADTQPPLCGNFVADALCRRYETLARQAGIDVELVAALPEDAGARGSDLAVFLGNLWENAAAALRAEEKRRYIRLQIEDGDGRILIRMENSYGGEIGVEEGRFLSTKPGRNNAEGIGIASVRAVAARYGGMADFTYTGDTFTASVLLYTGERIHKSQ